MVTADAMEILQSRGQCEGVLEREKLLVEILDRIGSEGLAGLIDVFLVAEDEEDGEHAELLKKAGLKDLGQFVVLDRWSEIDFEGAMAHVLSLKTQSGGDLGMIIVGLAAQRDAAAILAWVSERERSGVLSERRAAMMKLGLFSGAALDPSIDVVAFARENLGMSAEQIMERFEFEFLGERSADALAPILAIEKVATRRKALESLFAGWGNADMESALAAAARKIKAFGNGPPTQQWANDLAPPCNNLMLGEALLA